MSTDQKSNIFNQKGLEYNLATNTKWICQISFTDIFPDIRGELKLNLSSFRIPEMALGATETAYFTKKLSLPTRVLAPELQEITFEYLLSSNFHQYILLYRWMLRITSEMQRNSNFTEIGNPAKFRIPINIFLISEFKKPILKITYHDAWIQKIGEISFDYKNTTDDPILNSFTVKYSHFSIDTLEDVGGADGHQ